MKHPEKWRDTEDPYSLPYKNFSLLEVIGYPHAGNDVFQVKGIYEQREIEAYVKVARQLGAYMEGYLSIGKCNWDNVKYYMVLIYSYFYRIGRDDATYQSYIKSVFLNYCTT